MKSIQMGFVGVVFTFLAGCATTGILETPLKYGEQVSQDSIKVNFDLQTTSSAISKVNGQERLFECKFYNVKKISNDSWSIEIIEPSKVRAIRSDASQERERKRMFVILLTPAEDGLTLVGVRDGYIIDTAKGEPLPPDSVCEVDVCNQLLMFETKDSVEELNRPLQGPVKEEMNAEDLYYYFKSFILLVEKYLPEQK
ncbi:MAG: hypothetical protein PHS61_06065 [Candidatus Omnitrophica bacterium]|nr:hypothetical protein [Candidatus Omnitrophota bacterium]